MDSEPKYHTLVESANDVIFRMMSVVSQRFIKIRLKTIKYQLVVKKKDLHRLEF
jgi:hypothetical protein